MSKKFREGTPIAHADAALASEALQTDDTKRLIPDEGTDTGPGLVIQRPRGIRRKGSERFDTGPLVPDPTPRLGATGNREYSQ